MICTWSGKQWALTKRVHLGNNKHIYIRNQHWDETESTYRLMSVSMELNETLVGKSYREKQQALTGLTPGEQSHSKRGSIKRDQNLKQVRRAGRLRIGKEEWVSRASRSTVSRAEKTKGVDLKRCGRLRHRRERAQHARNTASRIWRASHYLAWTKHFQINLAQLQEKLWAGIFMPRKYLVLYKVLIASRWKPKQSLFSAGHTLEA